MAYFFFLLLFFLSPSLEFNLSRRWLLRTTLMCFTSAASTPSACCLWRMGRWVSISLLNCFIPKPQSSAGISDRIMRPRWKIDACVTVSEHVMYVAVTVYLLHNSVISHGRAACIAAPLWAFLCFVLVLLSDLFDESVSVFLPVETSYGCSSRTAASGCELMLENPNHTMTPSV